MDTPAIFQSHAVVEVRVKYSLADYYRVVAAHASIAMFEAGKRSWFSGWMAKWLIPVLATTYARGLGKLTPTYDFCFASDGIHRISEGRDHFVPWNEVKQVRRYPSAYFILVKGGAMPLPYRFLSSDIRKALDEAWPM